MVTGERETERFDRIESDPYFAPDGRVVYIARRGQRQYVGIDTVTFAFDWVGETFITTAGRLVISAQRGGMWEVLIDGVASGPQGHPFPISVASPDGRRIASVVRLGATWFVAFDGVVSSSYEEVRNLTFSRDSRHLAYAAKRGDKWMIVVDGAESPAYDEIVGFPVSDRLGIDSFTVLARRGPEDFRVTIPWPSR